MIIIFYQKDFQAAEIPSHSHISCYKYSSSAGADYPLHCHSYYEINYIIKGERYVILNGKRLMLSEGMLFFVPTLAVHGNTNITDVEDIVLQFSADFLFASTGNFLSDMALSSFDKENPVIVIKKSSLASEIINNLKSLCDEYENRIISYHNENIPLYESILLEFKRNGYILELISELIRSKDIVISDSRSSGHENEALGEIINHILQHPEEKTDMNEIAAKVGMSYYNFSRYFKKVTGFNFSEYCNMMRIRYAENLLIKTDKSITDIASQIGIDTPSYFTRLFKQINDISPIEYRKRFRN